MSAENSKEKAGSIVEPSRKTPVVAEADVVVIGGGPGGVPAAIAAARAGADVMLIEHYGFLGGLASAGMIGPLFGYNTRSRNDLMLGGIPVEILAELQSLGGAPQPGDINWNAIPFEPELMKHALERLAVREKKIGYLYHTHAVSVAIDGKRIDAVIVENKSGRSAIRGRIFVDATGDGDVAWLAGCEYTKGRPHDGLTQAMGTKFRAGGLRPVSDEELKKREEMFTRAIEDGRIHAYHPVDSEVSAGGATMRPNEATPTMTRAKGDGTNAWDLTLNEIKLRADTLEIINFSRREKIPGWENCYLMQTPTQIGIRETRQVTGNYILTAEDVRSAARFPDGIARGSWFFDIHCPMGKVSSKSWCCDRRCRMPGGCLIRNEHFDMLNATNDIPKGSYYEIPYRSLVPKETANLLVSGRCISADYKAMSSLRVIATCFAIGEAAGTAAGMCIKTGMDADKIDGAAVRSKLQSEGVPLQE